MIKCNIVVCCCDKILVNVAANVIQYVIKYNKNITLWGKMMNYIDRFDGQVGGVHTHLTRVSPSNYIIHCRITYTATFTNILS
jgi:hypothetical protein